MFGGNGALTASGARTPAAGPVYLEPSAVAASHIYAATAHSATLGQLPAEHLYAEVFVLQ